MSEVASRESPAGVLLFSRLLPAFPQLLRFVFSHSSLNHFRVCWHVCVHAPSWGGGGGVCCAHGWTDVGISKSLHSRLCELATICDDQQLVTHGEPSVGWQCSSLQASFFASQQQELKAEGRFMEK